MTYLYGSQPQKQRNFNEMSLMNNRFVNETGDDMHGTLDMNNNNIENINQPKKMNDAANKNYVDNMINKIKSELNTRVNNINTTITKMINNINSLVLKINNQSDLALTRKLSVNLLTKKYNVINNHVPKIITAESNPNEFTLIFADLQRRKSYYMLHIYIKYQNNYSVNAYEDVENKYKF